MAKRNSDSDWSDGSESFDFSDSSSLSGGEARKLRKGAVAPAPASASTTTAVKKSNSNPSVVVEDTEEKPRNVPTFTIDVPDQPTISSKRRLGEVHKSKSVDFHPRSREPASPTSPTSPSTTQPLMGDSDPSIAGKMRGYKSARNLTEVQRDDADEMGPTGGLKCWAEQRVEVTTLRVRRKVWKRRWVVIGHQSITIFHDDSEMKELEHHDLLAGALLVSNDEPIAKNKYASRTDLSPSLSNKDLPSAAGGASPRGTSPSDTSPSRSPTRSPPPESAASPVMGESAGARDPLEDSMTLEVPQAGMVYFAILCGLELDQRVDLKTADRGTANGLQTAINKELERNMATLRAPKPGFRSCPRFSNGQIIHMGWLTGVNLPPGSDPRRAKVWANYFVVVSDFCIAAYTRQPSFREQLDAPLVKLSFPCTKLRVLDASEETQRKNCFALMGGNRHALMLSCWNEATLTKWTQMIQQGIESARSGLLSAGAMFPVTYERKDAYFSVLRGGVTIKDKTTEQSLLQKPFREVKSYREQDDKVNVAFESGAINLVAKNEPWNGGGPVTNTVICDVIEMFLHAFVTDVRRAEAASTSPKLTAAPLPGDAPAGKAKDKSKSRA